ncbi:Thioredoxin-like [Bacteroides luti]|jgi:hypothetical protein|uniref:Thioredoxin-like n=1 Tax=Bacteroides luti TaxID=1297750 RepID=A0A1M4XKA3_9BACE|nr:DUF5106 domain-containing protein [Bacteroides luti]SHE93642.1 Thioredoxin-like [Bacteroides luti]
MKTHILLLYIICSVLTIGCKETKKRESQGVQMEKQTFRLPEIPNTLTTPQRRAKYLVEHYWDHFAFTDTSQIQSLDSIEPILADFLGVLPHTSYPIACSGIKKLMCKAESNTSIYSFLSKLAEKYLYESHSPIYNEELYLPFLESIVASKKVDDTYKLTYRYQLSMVRKNRPDSIATNFVYTLASGKSSTLAGLSSEYTLLFFNNPDCELCEEIREQIIASPVLSSLQNQKKNNKLIILSVYTEDEFGSWRKQLWKYPSNWICGYDKKQKIRNSELYDLRVIPSIYLLNREKRVLLKNPSFAVLENYFEKR